MDVEHFIIKRALSKEGLSSAPILAITKNPYFVDKPVDNHTKYYYGVSLSGDENLPDIRYIEVDQTAPDPPELRSSFRFNHSMEVYFSGSNRSRIILNEEYLDVDGGGYLLKRALTEEGLKTASVYKIIPDRSTYFVDDDVDNNTAYYYSLSAVDFSGNKSKESILYDSNLAFEFKDKNLETYALNNWMVIRTEETFGLPFFQLEASFLGYLALNEEVASVENLSGIENFSMVKELLIVNTLIADITPLTLMPELEVLTIEKSLVEDYSPLESLKNLRVLQVERKYMDNESISFLREKLPNLTINYL